MSSQVSSIAPQYTQPPMFPGCTSLGQQLSMRRRLVHSSLRVSRTVGRHGHLLRWRGGETGDEISRCDSPKPVHDGGEDREEEAATDDSVVEQPEEKEATSTWEVNDSPSESFQAHFQPVDRDSRSATSPPSASSCAHTDEQQAGSPEDTGAAKVLQSLPTALLAQAGCRGIAPTSMMLIR